MTFDDWWETLTGFEQAQRHHYDVMIGWEACQMFGIKAHDGQKLLVQHILDNDKGLSDSSRVILEKLIEE